MGVMCMSQMTVTSRKTVDTTKRGYPDFAVIRTTRNDLKAAPEFRYSRD